MLAVYYATLITKNTSKIVGNLEKSDMEKKRQILHGDNGEKIFRSWLIYRGKCFAAEL